MTALTSVPAVAAPAAPAPGTPQGELPVKDGKVVSEAPSDAPKGAAMGQAAQGPVAAEDPALQEGAVQGAAAAGDWQPYGIQGLDVSSHQPYVDWTQQYADGARFAYVKATEGTAYRSPAFDEQYIGSYQVGMVRGAYHFAIPIAGSTGAEQADYFVDNGGGWSADGRTLPGLLDIEYNPYPVYGDQCYNRTPEQMISWIRDFSDRYKERTGRVPAIYTTTHWWSMCTGNTDAFNDHPLMIANWTGTPFPLPNGWSDFDIWQYSESGPFPGDSNVFGGTFAELDDFASNADYTPRGGTSPAAAPAPEPAPTGDRAADGPFVDVTWDMLHAQAIAWAQDNGILTGWADGTFRPHKPINRDAMAAVIYRMSGSPAYTPPAVSPYRDVQPGDQFYKEITWARQTGLLTGWADGTFRPLYPIDRDATAALFYRASGSPAYQAPAQPQFTDVRPGQQFYEEIHWRTDSGLSTGWADGTYRPQESTHRDAMAAFLQRFAG